MAEKPAGAGSEYDRDDPRRMSPSELRSGGAFDSPEIVAARGRGIFWAAEFACPVVLAEFPSLDEEPTPKTAPRFLGSATLLGGDLFLSARHVFFKRDGTPIYGPIKGGTKPRPALAITRMKARPDIAIAAIDWIEAPPDRRCDLVLGKLVQWDATPPWNGLVAPAALTDVTAVGYPYDRMAVLNTGDVDALHAAVNSPRYLQGYVTRGVEVLLDPLMSPYSFEVSFSLTEGMSGCPLWYYKDNERFLYGIASGSLSQTRLAQREERIERDGTRVVTETYRVEDYGVGVRLDTVFDWRVAQLERRTLTEILATALDAEDKPGGFWRRLSRPFRHG